MITAASVELRAGSRLLLDAVSFRVAPGDRVGLVGRNGAGKTTLTKALAGVTQPAAGTITRTGEVGYLPQDPRGVDLDVTARDRVLSARGLDTIVRDLRAAEVAMGTEAGERQERAMRRYTRLDAEFTAAGGYAAESEAAAIAGALGLDERVLGQTLGTLSGGQRRRIELARILFSGAETLLLDEPTNHLDADSITWLRDHLRGYKGGLVVISHDVDLLEAVVNKVFHLDANRGELDQYSLGWRAYLQQRETDERRRKRERANAEKKASVLMAQADKMRAKATKTVAAQNMARRAERLLSGLEAERAPRQGGEAPLPQAGRRAAGLRCGPAACRGRTGRRRSSPTSTSRSTGAPASSCWASTVPARPRSCGCSAGVDPPDTGEVEPGHGLKIGYYAQEHENLDVDRTSWRT